MAQFQSSILRRFWEEEESDDDDICIVASVLMHRRRNRSNKKFRGSLPGRQNVPRILSGGHTQLCWDYFSDHSVYNEKHFRRRFRMSKSLFMRIVNAVEAHDDYFTQRPIAVEVLGTSALQKVVVAFRMLAYGVSADFLDDYVRMAESTTLEDLDHFIVAIVEIFGEEYLRAPNAEDTARLLAINSARGFSGMLGFVDCMHWKWNNCPTAWRGAYTGHFDGPTMILEAVASKDLWIRHMFFGMPGSLNDLNVLRRSPLFDRLTLGTSPPVEYMVNGNKYTMGYYLTDGIYPSWATFVKIFRNLHGNKQALFKAAQEAARKDVERAFGVLQARFGMVRGSARCWRKDQLWYIMHVCIIMHNIIVEDERGKKLSTKYHQVGVIEVLKPPSGSTCTQRFPKDT